MIRPSIRRRSVFVGMCWGCPAAPSFSCTELPVWRSWATRPRWWVNLLAHRTSLNPERWWNTDKQKASVIHAASYVFVIVLPSIHDPFLKIKNVLWSSHNPVHLFMFISRSRPIYSRAWRGRLLTSTGMFDIKHLLHALCVWMRDECPIPLFDATAVTFIPCKAFRVLQRSLTWSVRWRWSCLWCPIQATSA